MPENNQEELKKMVQTEVQSQLSFTSRKLADTPTDDLQVVNRKYTNLNGTTANRPTNNTPGQFYFDNTIGRPIYYNPNSSVFVDGAGSVS